jgi:hypothetical protein
MESLILGIRVGGIVVGWMEYEAVWWPTDKLGDAIIPDRNALRKSQDSMTDYFLKFPRRWSGPKAMVGRSTGGARANFSHKSQPTEQLLFVTALLHGILIAVIIPHVG